MPIRLEFYLPILHSLSGGEETKAKKKPREETKAIKKSKLINTVQSTYLSFILYVL